VRSWPNQGLVCSIDSSVVDFLLCGLADFTSGGERDNFQRFHRGTRDPRWVFETHSRFRGACTIPRNSAPGPALDHAGSGSEGSIVFVNLARPRPRGGQQPPRPLSRVVPWSPVKPVIVVPNHAGGDKLLIETQAIWRSYALAWYVAAHDRAHMAQYCIAYRSRLHSPP
jgi:hypothetical protein